MRLFRWLSRGFHDGHIVEAGEEILCGDHVIPGDHMLDVATGLRGNQAPAAPTVIVAAPSNVVPLVMRPPAPPVVAEPANDPEPAVDTAPSESEPVETPPAEDTAETDPVVETTEEPVETPPEVPA